MSSDGYVRCSKHKILYPSWHQCCQQCHDERRAAEYKLEQEYQAQQGASDPPPERKSREQEVWERAQAAQDLEDMIRANR